MFLSLFNFVAKMIASRTSARLASKQIKREQTVDGKEANPKKRSSLITRIKQEKPDDSEIEFQDIAEDAIMIQPESSQPPEQEDSMMDDEDDQLDYDSSLPSPIRRKTSGRSFRSPIRSSRLGLHLEPSEVDGIDSARTRLRDILTSLSSADDDNDFFDPDHEYGLSSVKKLHRLRGPRK